MLNGDSQSISNIARTDVRYKCRYCFPCFEHWRWPTLIMKTSLKPYGQLSFPFFLIICCSMKRLFNGSRHSTFTFLGTLRCYFWRKTIQRLFNGSSHSTGNDLGTLGLYFWRNTGRKGFHGKPPSVGTFVKQVVERCFKGSPHSISCVARTHARYTRRFRFSCA